MRNGLEEHERSERQHGGKWYTSQAVHCDRDREVSCSKSQIANRKSRNLSLNS
jgi:hypothetical protein